MELTLNSAVLGVEITGIRRFTYLVRDTPGACALTIGEPDQNTPDAIKEAAKAALDANDTHYPPGNGYPYMLQAISDYEARAHGLRYDPEEIILTIGATEGLFIGLSTILNPGDEVIIPTPAFGLYESITRLLRGVPVSLPTEKNHFQIDPEALRAVITPKTKAIVLHLYGGDAQCRPRSAQGPADFRVLRRCVPGAGIYGRLPQLCRVSGHAGPNHRDPKLLQALCHDWLAAWLLHGGHPDPGPDADFPPARRGLRTLLRSARLCAGTEDGRERCPGVVPQAPG